ncbi:MAG: FAD-dependent oxidoreductase [Planctomycetota bacterium]
MPAPLEHRDGFDRLSHRFDVVVVGGGMSGMCAALASARHGAKTALVHDRPVFGGNASSEIRMWICGAHGSDNKETGILEEILLDNAALNPTLNYSVWDAALFRVMNRQPNLTLFMNCSCTGCETEGSDASVRITTITAWQLTSQTWHTLEAARFIDCSGDSILAPASGAAYRWGREARAEFDEPIAPEKPDRKTMGNTLLIQLRRTDEVQPFTAPDFAYRFDDESQFNHRLGNGVNAHNFWWLELGGIWDTIADAEAIRDDLMRLAWGVWDYIKNVSPHRKDAETWALEWIGSLPGKRENRRYEGLHIMTQHDVESGGRFDDVVAHGGWSMDDHHPAGMLYPGKPTIFHPAPSPYGIPYRSLASRNVENLLFAGRNISVTHAALSSTRVMATCAVIGQAAGTAAAMSVRKGVKPATIYPDHVGELQALLQADDQYLPGVPRVVDELSRSAVTESPVLDGYDRELDRVDHAWVGEVGGAVELSWDRPVEVGGVRCVFDSNLKSDKRMPCNYPQGAGLKGSGRVPRVLVKAFRVEARGANGSWSTVYRNEQNHQRLLRVPVSVTTDRLRLVPEETWGSEQARVFGFEATRGVGVTRPADQPRPTFAGAVSAVKAEDLAAPDHGLEDVVGRHGAGA